LLKILAREFNIPTIVGIENACGIFKEGQEVVINCELSQVEFIGG